VVALYKLRCAGYPLWRQRQWFCNPLYVNHFGIFGFILSSAIVRRSTANGPRRIAGIDQAADIAAAATGADATIAADRYEFWPVGGITNGIGAGGRQNIVANQHVIGGQPQMTDRQREQVLASQFQQAEAAQARQ